MSSSPPLDSLLQRDNTVTLVALLLLWALTWVYLGTGAGLTMNAPMPAMSPAEMAAMSTTWNARTWLLMVGMWWAMMVAMMTPGAAPVILLYARTHRHAQSQGQVPAGHAPTGAFVTGYFLVWLVFSIAATGLHQGLESAGMISAMGMDSQSRWLTGTTLVLTGLYQLSPLKNACLAHCRAPAQFLSQHWRPGASGALRLGVLHGAYCVGCCWLLMALLFIGGVMNLAWIAALSALVLAEKLLPGGRWIGRAAGVALVCWGALVLF